MQCPKCYRLGYTKNHCKFPRCHLRGGPTHMDSTCDNYTSPCFVCDQDDHVTGSWACPTYIFQQQAFKISDTRKITQNEAFNLLRRTSAPPSVVTKMYITPQNPNLPPNPEGKSELPKWALLKPKSHNLVSTIQPLILLPAEFRTLKSTFNEIGNKFDTLMTMATTVESLKADFDKLRALSRDVINPLGPADLPHREITPFYLSKQSREP